MFLHAARGAGRHAWNAGRGHHSIDRKERVEANMSCLVASGEVKRPRSRRDSTPVLHRPQATAAANPAVRHPNAAARSAGTTAARRSRPHRPALQYRYYSRWQGPAGLCKHTIKSTQLKEERPSVSLTNPTMQSCSNSHALSLVKCKGFPSPPFQPASGPARGRRWRRGGGRWQS